MHRMGENEQEKNSFTKSEKELGKGKEGEKMNRARKLGGRGVKWRAT